MDNATNEIERLERVNGSPATTLKYSGEKPATPILDTIPYPGNMKNLCVKVIEVHL